MHGAVQWPHLERAAAAEARIQVWSDWQCSADNTRAKNAQLLITRVHLKSFFF